VVKDKMVLPQLTKKRGKGHAGKRSKAELSGLGTGKAEKIRPVTSFKTGGQASKKMNGGGKQNKAPYKAE